MAASVAGYLHTHRERIVAELIEFAGIPSVSTDSAYADGMAAAAQWVAGQLARAGIQQVQILPTARHPVVYGEWLGAPGAPTLLVYGHYDVQPPDPLDAWQSPPFAPQIRDGRLYARGVSDDKGPMLIPIKVAEAYLATDGRLPVNVKFLFEGEEEIGSPSLEPFIAAHTTLLAADYVLSADGAMWRVDLPSITVASRGMAGLEFTLTGAAKDLHSGRHGGAVANALHAVAELVASLHTSDGRAAVAGFYDEVVGLTRGAEVEKPRFLARRHGDAVSLLEGGETVVTAVAKVVDKHLVVIESATKGGNSGNRVVSGKVPRSGEADEVLVTFTDKCLKLDQVASAAIGTKEDRPVFRTRGREGAAGLENSRIGGFLRKLCLGDEAVEDHPLLSEEKSGNLFRSAELGEKVVRLEHLLIRKTLALVGESEHGLEVAKLELETSLCRFESDGPVPRRESGEPQAVEPLLPVRMILAKEAEIQFVGLAIRPNRLGVVAEFAVRVADTSDCLGDLDVLPRAKRGDPSICHATVQLQGFRRIPRCPLDLAEEEQGLEGVGMGWP